jgi:hypothetical protein
MPQKKVVWMQYPNNGKNNKIAALSINKFTKCKYTDFLQSRLQSVLSTTKHVSQPTTNTFNF